MIKSFRSPRHRFAGLLIMLFGLSSCASLLTPDVETELVRLKAGQYSLDKTHASLLFKVKHMGLSSYVGRFNNFEASLDFQPEAIERSKLTAVIEMNSLDINNADLRSDLMRAKWFNVNEYPQATFTTLSVTQGQGAHYDFIGELDWRGVKKQIPMQVMFHGGANNILTGKYTVGFSAKTNIKRSDFGMDTYIPLVADNIELEAHAEFQRQ